jgi:hypothetical protein
VAGYASGRLRSVVDVVGLVREIVGITKVGASAALVRFFAMAGLVVGVTRSATAGGRAPNGPLDAPVTPVITEETASHATAVAAAVPTVHVAKAIDRRTG